MNRGRYVHPVLTEARLRDTQEELQYTVRALQVTSLELRRSEKARLAHKQDAGEAWRQVHELQDQGSRLLGELDRLKAENEALKAENEALKAQRMAAMYGMGSEGLRKLMERSTY